MSKRVILGVLAHVDAGKTTLSEAMLYRSGRIRKLGRVDHGDAYLDTDALERQRGITIFSKQARLKYGDLDLTLVDTPGHVDFSSEMERTLSILDYALLVVSASDGIQGHAETLWRLLRRYRVPTFIFVNKMDSPGADHDRVLDRIRRRWSPACADFSRDPAGDELEDMALLDESCMDEYLKTGGLAPSSLARLIADRKVFPCLFGSALKLDGVDRLLEVLEGCTLAPEYPSAFGARVYKVSHDEHGDRLTWLKVTGGSLQVKAALETGREAGGDGGHGGLDPDRAAGPAGGPPPSFDIKGDPVLEKVDQVRLYSGARYDLVEQVPAGTLCAVTGLDLTRPGQGLGASPQAPAPLLEPVLAFTVLTGDEEPHRVLQALKVLQDEDPQLHVVWQDRLQEIRLRLMGKVQLEVVREELHGRFGLDVDFSPGSILYRETIESPVEGVGHFEPLRHYAEVHLLLEPTGRGSGLTFASTCSQDRLDRSWQRLILTHLGEREHLGVLTGSPITDMRITLIDGRAHEKHTEGGDFRQATYRAVRQGLMKARSILLEPWYRFRLEIPRESLGRAMSDIQRMEGTFVSPTGDGDYMILEGEAPVSGMRDYAPDVTAYTHGRGHLTCISAGYRPCHDQEAVVRAAAYDPESDLENTPDSVFCAHGAGYTVKWNRVEDFMHLDGGRYI
ncbi:translation factor GTPase family protein [Bifidobacterium favimelis]|uniref:Translation factor GTPase family protein n=1 Tax=Bifidobacterium favimelis TaxID=3122979 RepID=A0ABU8ZM44_9BIFI